MAGVMNWRDSLTASERYDNIQKLTQGLAAAGLSQDAFSLESKAYETSSSREEYDAACNPPTSAAPHASLSSPQVPSPDVDDRESSPGITIGPYSNCHYIASGVTAEVYRAQARALKVIVETHNIEPHSPRREAKILSLLRASAAPNVIPLLETFQDASQRLVLVFPYQPLTLAHLLSQETTTPSTSPLPPHLLRPIFTALFTALHHLHAHAIIHRDVKPAALLLSTRSPTSPSHILLSDFGTAYHPTLSPPHEPPNHKVLDIGTGPYRAPETLFGDRSYATAVDLWAAGTTLAECLRGTPLFESRAAHEDGNQLGLVLSIFQTLGTPTRETWPEAAAFRTPPFEMYRGWRELVAGLVRYESGERVTAQKALEFECLKGEDVEVEVEAEA